MIPSGLRPRLLLLILLTVGSSMGLMLATALQQRGVAVGNASSEAMLLGRLAAAHEERSLAVVHQLLRGLAHDPAVLACDARATAALIATLDEPRGTLVDLSAIAPDGRVFASTDAALRGRDVSGAPWFEWANGLAAFAVAPYAADSLGEAVALRCSMPARDGSGRVHAILVTSLDLDWLRRTAARARLPGNTSFLLVDPSGRVVTSGRSGGRPDSTVKPFAAARALEWTQDVRGGDGVVRHVAFTPLAVAPGHPLYIGVGIDAATVARQASRAFEQSLALMALLGVAIALAAWRGASLIVLRRIEALLRAADRLRAGDLTARSGLPYGRGELSRLAIGFDEMAARLERHERSRARAVDHLRRSEARKSAVLEASIDGIFVLDPSGVVVECNGAAARMLACSRRELRRRHFASLLEGPAPALPDAALRAPTVQENALRRRDGVPMPVEVVVVPVRDRAARGLCVATVRDITDRKRWQRALEAQSFVDDLTGLYNRRGFSVFGTQQLRLAARSGQSVVMVSLDLDDLKRINDTLGHATGDRAIVEVATVLRAAFRETDVVARLGGDEFVVLAIETDERGIERAIRRMLQQLADRSRGGEFGAPLTVSIGWRRAEPSDHLTLTQLLAEADARMYQQKRLRPRTRQQPAGAA